MIYLRKNDVLLFQGDSITQGGRVESKTDFNHIIGHGYQDYIAQRLGVDNIDRNPKIINRGVIGDHILLINQRKQEDIFDLEPTILSILDGTNDASSYLKNRGGAALDTFEKVYTDILGECRSKFPQIRFIIGQPFRYAATWLNKDKDDMEMEKRIVENVRARADIVESIAKKFNAVFVKYWDMFDEYVKKYPVNQIIWDGIHPTYVGHGLMAEKWLKTVEKAFNG